MMETSISTENKVNTKIKENNVDETNEPTTTENNVDKTNEPTTTENNVDETNEPTLTEIHSG